jgi:alpha-galactosidase
MNASVHPVRPLRIVIIGGGSFTWGPTFLRDIFSIPELYGSRLVLHDIDPTSLNLVYTLGLKMLADFALPFQLEKTLSLDEALIGADAVILTISTGGLEAMRHDLEIPAAYGIHQSVGDTVGPGGLARALRNIPVVAEIGRRVMETCPKALFLNYTNPMSTLTRTLALQGVNVIGLCHEYMGVREKLAALYHVAATDIQARVAGINHLTWITGLWIAGRDVWADLPALAAKILSGELEIEPGDDSPMADHWKVKAHLFQLYGALPAAGDRHIAEFFPFFLTEATGWGATHGVQLTSVAHRYAWREEAFSLITAALAGSLDLPPFMMQPSGEAAAPILATLAGGGSYSGVFNLPNHGQVQGLPAEAIVETLGTFDSAGAHATTFGILPSAIQAVLDRHISNQELTVQAALSGSRKLAMQALLNEPLLGSLTITKRSRMLDEMLLANRAWLPQFFA